jgi:membrane associated rhomboid family serine protease
MAYNFKPSRSIPPVTLNLIIINVIVFVGQMVLDSSLNITMRFGLYSLNSGYFEPYQLVTHMFLHGGFLHIAFNMYALWLFGAVLERLWGPKKFLIFYLACGLAAGVAQMLLVNGGPAIGASGAIMGLLAGFAYTFPNTEFYIIPFPFPIKAKWMAAVYAAIDLFGGFAGGDDVAHFAHLGGLAMGFLLVIIWNKTDKKTLY